MNEIWKKRLLILFVVLVIGSISVVNFKLQNDKVLETSSEFVAYEEEQLEGIKGDLIIGGRDGFDELAMEENTEVTVQVSENDYFDEAQSVINMDRNKIISMLTEIIEDRDIDANSKNKAAEQKLQIIEFMNQEKIVENLLKNKGYEEVLILITDNSVNVTVGVDTLNKSDIAKVLDVVMRETGRPFDQIIIQNKQ